MKRTFLIILVLSSISYIAGAQMPPPEAQERIEAKKVAFLTDRLDLSVEEAQKFWPVYNELTAKRKELKQQRHQQIKPTNFQSEEEALKELQKYFEQEEAKATLEKDYAFRFAEIIPPSKVVKLIRLERVFIQKVLEEFRTRGRRK